MPQLGDRVDGRQRALESRAALAGCDGQQETRGVEFARVPSQSKTISGNRCASVAGVGSVTTYACTTGIEACNVLREIRRQR